MTGFTKVLAFLSLFLLRTISVTGLLSIFKRVSEYGKILEKSEKSINLYNGSNQTKNE
jgi:hypothetical protein